MIMRILFLVGLLIVAAAAAWWYWFTRCERACAALEVEAQYLFQRGEFLAALTLIDTVDARCRCERFTSGDTPPQYALAQACIRQLLSEGHSAEVGRLLTSARGTILRELAKRTDLEQN
jgi:hypothetical protein